MPTGLMVNVMGGSGLGSLFHPTLPFSYILGSFPLAGYWGPGVNSLETYWEAPQVLNKPWFTLAGTESTLGNYYFEKVAGTAKTYKIVGNRYISLIDPRNGYVYYLYPERALLSEAVITVGDIRG